MEGSLVAYKVFTNGSVLNASEVNENLMNQAVITFSNSTARGSAIASPVEGMLTYLEDTQTYESWDGAAWVALITPASSGNAIINGAFEINQRNFTSTALSTTTFDVYSFDRWKINNVGDGTSTFSSETFTLGSAPIAGYEGTKFMRMVSSGFTNAASRTDIVQSIESVRTFAGQTITISFFARAASGTPKIAIETQQNFGTGGSPSTVNNNAVGTVTLSTTFQRYSITTTLDSITGKTLGTNGNDHFNARFFVNAGADLATRASSIGIQNNTFDIWGVQVEAGSTATPFRRNANSIQGELAACQRYYQRYSGTGSGQVVSNLGTAASTTVFVVPTTIPEMRVSPTSVGISDLVIADGVTTDVVSGVSMASSTPRSLDLRFTSSTLTQYRPGWVRLSSATGYLEISAEL
jgi:hypothetical protein